MYADIPKISKSFVALAIIVVAALVAFWGGVGFVAWHFISKFW